MFDIFPISLIIVKTIHISFMYGLNDSLKQNLETSNKNQSSNTPAMQQ